MISEYADNLWGNALPPVMPAQETTSVPRKRTKDPLHSPSKTNPCITVYGPGPEGKHCRTCTLLMHVHYHDGRYFKCQKRGKPTHGAGTDHRAKWPACSEYQETKA